MISYFACTGPNPYHFALECSRHKRLKDAVTKVQGKRGWSIIRAEDGPGFNQGGKRSVAQASDGYWEHCCQQFCERVNEGITA